MKTTRFFKFISSLMLAFLASALVASAVGVPSLTAPLFGATMILGVSLQASGIDLYAFSLVTGTPIAFNGTEAKKGIVLPAFKKPMLDDFCTIVEGVVAKQQIAFLPRLSKITRTDPGCGSGVVSKTLTPTQLFWNPAKAKFWLQQCADDLETTLFVWAMKNGVDRKDLDRTYFMEYLMEIATDGAYEDALRLIWFGDTNVDTIANGSFLGSNTDIPNYDLLDGFWSQIFTAVGASTMKRVTIAENALTPASSQLALGTTTAIDTFREMIETADKRLKNLPQSELMILCTDTLFDNWLTYKETRNLDNSFLRQEKGYSSDVYRGVKIVKFDSWDRNIQADMSNGTVYQKPHRALLTTKDNLQVGFNVASDRESFKYFFDDTTELCNLKGMYQMDAKILMPFMAVAAY